MNSNPHIQPDSIDLLMQQVAHELANQPQRPGLEARLQAGLEANLQTSLQQRTPMPASNVLSFPTPTFLTLDRSAAQPTSRRTVATAILLHAAAILLITFLVATKTNLIAPARTAEITLVAPPPPALKAPPKATTAGGGGGQQGPAPAAKGNLPKFAPQQLNPPKAPPTVAPKIAVPVTVDVDQNLKMATTNVPNFGMPNSPLVGTSLGNGRGTGIGSGSGAGIGVGVGGNVGGGVRRIGGGVSAPVPLFTPEPEFSEEARKAKAAGNVLVYLQVGTDGRPLNVRVLRGIGLGLDEKALEAVKQYRFKPAMENGKPVRVEMNVEVGFQIF